MGNISRREFIGAGFAAAAGALAVTAKDALKTYKDKGDSKKENGKQVETTEVHLEQSQIKDILQQVFTQVVAEIEANFNQTAHKTLKVGGAGLTTGSIGAAASSVLIDAETDPLISASQSAIVGSIAAAGGAIASAIKFNNDNADKLDPFYQKAVNIRQSIGKLSTDLANGNSAVFEYMGIPKNQQLNSESLKQYAAIYFENELSKENLGQTQNEQTRAKKNKPAHKK